jgi:ribose 5-phosphate isomerase B
MMTIVIGSDEAAYDMKEALKAYVESLGHTIIDCGTYDGAAVLYPDIAAKAASIIAKGEARRGILCCGTGIGMSITANKIPGIRAAHCHDTYSAERAIKSNNAQILTMGARVIGLELSKSIVKVFLESEFVDGSSTPKVERIDYYDQKYRKG